MAISDLTVLDTDDHTCFLCGHSLYQHFDDIGCVVLVPEYRTEKLMSGALDEHQVKTCRCPILGDN